MLSARLSSMSGPFADATGLDADACPGDATRDLVGALAHAARSQLQRRGAARNRLDRVVFTAGPFALHGALAALAELTIAKRTA